MSENDVIRNTPAPNTIHTLNEELRRLGIEPGCTVFVHASMKSLGWTSGGPQAVIEALMEAITPEGTLVLQTHTPTLSDPGEWENPPVPENWHETIRDTMPGFDPDKTPSTLLGVLPEVFRKFPDVIRSSHPTFSMAAWGMQADRLMSDHPLEYSLSDTSPLGKAYHSNALVLFLGVGYDSNTCFHLSEYRSKKRKEIKRGAPVKIRNATKWTTYKDIEFDEEVFEEIGKDFEDTYEVTKGKVGMADCRVFPMKEAVDFALKWLNQN